MPTLTSTRREWTPAQDKIIMSNLDSMTHAEIAQKLGRTTRAIDQRIQTLGISNKKTNRKFTLDELEQIKTMRDEKMPIQKIADKLNRTFQSVAAKIYGVGL